MDDINNYLEKLIDLAINVAVLFFFLIAFVGVIIFVIYAMFLMISGAWLL